MKALFRLTIAHRFGDEAVRRLDLEDSPERMRRCSAPQGRCSVRPKPPTVLESATCLTP